VKVEMRQIGARQEAGKVGGIASCGRELCCSTWLTDFKSVNTTAARYQNLSINQTKLSGQCGRLKCCLNYELDTYLDALQHFPDNADVIQITRSPAYLVKKDIFKNLMWYTLPDSNKHYPLSIARVKEIQKMNALGQKPDDLEPVELVSSKPKEVEPEFVDVVGQISLRSLERNSRRRKDKEQQGNQRGSGEKREMQQNAGPQGGGGQKGGGGQQNRPAPAQPGQQKAAGQNNPQRQGPNQQRNVNKPAGVPQQGKPQQGQQPQGQQPQNRPNQQGGQQNRPAQQGGNQQNGSATQGGGQQNRPQQQRQDQRPPQQKQGQQQRPQQQRPQQKPPREAPPATEGPK
jgi:hypothetical protein